MAAGQVQEPEKKEHKAWSQAPLQAQDLFVSLLEFELSNIRKSPRALGRVWLFYLVGVDCFGYVSYSTSSELTVLVTFLLYATRRRVDYVYLAVTSHHADANT